VSAFYRLNYLGNIRDSTFRSELLGETRLRTSEKPTCFPPSLCRSLR
jgi:hypothetical protein